ncbi:MAG: hypothetical protein ACD_41C00057G0001 [uncultured bacterium]|nr:MAG: hypothetical protein ACD_41C00057G0001 [uncultured bacterium]
MLEQIQLNSTMHHWLRRQKDVLLLPIVKICLYLQIKPVLVTSIGALFGTVSLPLLWIDYRWFALAQLASLLCDGIDGSLARYSKRPSEFGKQFDYAVDVSIMLLTYSAVTVWLKQPIWIIGLNWYIGLWLVNWLFGRMLQLAPMRLLLTLSILIWLPQLGLALTWAYAVVMSFVLLKALLRKRK